MDKNTRHGNVFENVTHGSKKKKLNGEIVGCCNNAINEKSLVVCMNYCISFMQDGKELLKKRNFTGDRKNQEGKRK